MSKIMMKKIKVNMNMERRITMKKLNKIIKEHIKVNKNRMNQ
jgi:hypothetical protein